MGGRGIPRRFIHWDLVRRGMVNLDLVSRDAESSARSAVGGGHGFRARTSRRTRRAPLRQASASRLTSKARTASRLTGKTERRFASPPTRPAPAKPR